MFRVIEQWNRERLEQMEQEAFDEVFQDLFDREEEFRDAIRKASLRNFSEVRSVLRGGHAADHPTLMQFPEGFYLKMYVHYVL